MYEVQGSPLPAGITGAEIVFDDGRTAPLRGILVHEGEDLLDAIARAVPEGATLRFHHKH